MVQKQPISRFHTYLIFIASLALIAGCIVLNISLFYGFFAGFIFSIIVLRQYGYSARMLLGMAARGIYDCRIIFAVIFLMGMAIAIWMASGVVPSLIYYGLTYIQHINFLLACFLITTVVAVFMGTAVGTISTIGVALLVIGRGLNIPIPILMGAIVSGAFAADRLSPVSGLVNLTLNTTRIKYQEYLPAILKTFVPSLLITSLIYLYMGQKYMTQIDERLLSIFQQNIKATFYISPLLLLFPVLIIAMAAMGVKVVPNMSLGVAGGLIISIFLQKMSFFSVLKILFFGYKAQIAMPELNKMLQGGGILTMMEVVFIVAGAVALSSLFEGVNIISPFINSIAANIKNKGVLVSTTAILSSALTVLTCDQTVGILFLGKYLQNDFARFGLSRTQLARTISDTGTTIAPLIPWNVNALIILAMTGVASVQYAPYTFFCYVTPLVTIALGFIGSLKKSYST